jgi:Ca-activated chloride channel family protein
MVRPVIAFAVVALCASARASEMPRRMGMYTVQGGAPLAMLDSKLDVTVRGPIVESTVTQTFRNDTDRATEATYIFPLPIDAAVSAMAIKTGARTIHASIERREDAQRRYEQAVAAGIGAALLDQERPDVFTQTVSAIPAHGMVVVTMRFDSVARYRAGTWELVLPMVVAPRYVPGTASGRPTTGTGRAPDTDRSPDASRVTPGGSPGAGGKTEVMITFADSVDGVTSPTHELASSGGGYAFTDPKTDHDAIVRWCAKLPSNGWVEQADDGGYAAIVVEAPAAKPRTAPVRCMLILDRAATTRGDADAVEHPFVRALFGALGAKDQAAVTGSDQVDWRAPDQALRAIDDAWPKSAGAFDLSKVLGGLRAQGGALVLVSDGLVADDRAAISAAARVGAPIHVIGVGPAPNRSLLTAIASSTGGTIRFAAIGDDLNALARDVLGDLGSPPAPLAVNWGTLAASEVVPAVLPRLGAGQAALVIARVARVQAANARVRGDVFLLATIATTRAPEGATTPRGSLARRWARTKLDELVAGGDRVAITKHALRYGLVSPTTSMVAIGEEVVSEGGVKHSVPVPVSVPAGMHWQAVQQQTSVDTTAETPHTESLDVDRNREAAKHKTSGAKRNDESEASDERRPDAEEPLSKPQSAPVAVSVDFSGEAVEEVLVKSETVAASRSHRFALSLGAGVAIQNGHVDPMTALTGRFDLGGRSRIGVEGSLWLVGGLHLQGETMISLARRGIARWFELGGGFGVHFGGGTGPAIDLTLRTRLPVRHLATYLRYDGALLFHDQTRDVQNSTSFGIEGRW